MSTRALPFGPIGPHAVHVAVDMQRLFAEQTEWHTPALAGIIAPIARIAAHAGARSIFTRFRAPLLAEDAPGQWRTYYRRWRSVLASRNEAALYDLVPRLAALVPPAAVIDKPGYSAFGVPAFEAALDRLGADTLIITGVETDVCVLATVLGAVDRGLRVILVTDALASSAPAAHAATLEHVIPRFDQQIELIDTATLLQCWTP